MSAPSPTTLPETLSTGTSAVRAAHRTHAIAMLVVPALGTGLAFYDAHRHSVTALDLGLFAVFYIVSGLGITVGFHRLLAHRSFRAPAWIEAGLTIAGSIAGQGPAIYWVANHRRHHRHSDRSGDPHSPYVRGDEPLRGVAGFLHAHLGWTIDHELTSTVVYAPDLLRRPLLRAVNRHYLLWLMGGLLLPAVLGGLLTGSWRGAYSGLLWGGFVRLFFAYQFTLAINSATHLLGERTFDTGDQSRNSFWLALPTLGEAWHNNHHAFPTAAVFSAAWWQVDLGGYFVLLLARLRLVDGIKSVRFRLLQKEKE